MTDPATWGIWAAVALLGLIFWQVLWLAIYTESCRDKLSKIEALLERK